MYLLFMATIQLWLMVGTGFCAADAVTRLGRRCRGWHTSTDLACSVDLGFSQHSLAGVSVCCHGACPSSGAAEMPGEENLLHFHKIHVKHVRCNSIPATVLAGLDLSSFDESET